MQIASGYHLAFGAAGLLVLTAAALAVALLPRHGAAAAARR